MHLFGETFGGLVDWEDFLRKNLKRTSSVLLTSPMNINGLLTSMR